ncbi:2-oxoglutarate and iron-dependent oxygenase JMJD4 [Strongylocentrotus purpuratus]|uniref:2-oxoglutarate and iron-dependent oxygenase JMJD4 n=1 Tax=Strongylocentrotus purpuratus TaxID=7668 RepID=A0A7M7RFA7_STRPU|nr:2-oxoglutarate and iron-dependent oxygenase JMJD4 [Strongylocentrotus purpuratus]|eukprot:XP_797590.2 PREDICTED: jmjC domain-containing protein 4 [Strongylocentrotus purpuratus]
MAAVPVHRSNVCEILAKLGVSEYIPDLRKGEGVHDIEFVENSMSYDEFFRSFLLPNKPCLLGKHATEHWRSVKEWVLNDGTPNFEYIEAAFGDVTVPVANCGKEKYYAQPKQDMKMSDYLQYWKKHIEMDHNSPEGCLYLKDWHFTKAFPDYGAYTTPIYFKSDWLNEFWDHRQDQQGDDYRFVYMGPKGSWTPFHADVFRSYSWSANICGKKRWLFYPPGAEDHLRDTLGNLAYDVTSPEIDDLTKYPHRHKAGEPLEVIQESGQVIFVPSGWHHQVFNLEDTISINHNWLNGCNLDITWRFLQSELQAVQKSIEDCRDMEGWADQCQLIMKASTGMDYAEFFNYLHIISSHRLQSCNENRTDSTNTVSSRDKSDTPNVDSLGTHQVASCAVGSSERAPVLTNINDGNLSVNHFVFDLWRIQQILEDMIGNQEFKEIDSRLSQKPENLLQDIRTELDIA